MLLKFEEFVLDTEAFELRGAIETLELEPKVFDLIRFFAMHPQQLITREELLASVWQGRIVSDTSIASCIKAARKALGDSGSTQRYVQTVRGRGYRFMPEVVHIDSGEKSETQNRSSTAAHTASAPSLLVVPFKTTGADPVDVQLANSLTLDINAILNRIPLLQISAEGNQFTHDGHSPSARELYDLLGIDFVVDGSIQNRSNSTRVYVNLTLAQTGMRLWGEAFDATSNGPDSERELVSKIIGKLEPQLHKAMFDLVSTAQGDTNAQQLFLQANGMLVMQGWNHVSFASAGALLAQSSALDETFALAPALHSLLYGFGNRIGLAQDRKTAEMEARRTAEKALELDSMDSTILGLTGCSLADVGDVQRGEALINAAIDANPSNAQALVALGAVHLTRLDALPAIEFLSAGIDISPLDSRLSVWGALLSIAHLLNGDLQQSSDTAMLACRRHDKTYLPRIALAASALLAGETGAATQAMADARRIKPDLNLSQVSALAGKELGSQLFKL